MEVTREWWSIKSDNERAVFALLGVASIAVLFWVLLLLPLMQARANAEDRYLRSTSALSFVQAAGAELRRAETQDGVEVARDPIAALPLRQAVPNAASQSGLAISRVQPESENQITIWVEDVDARRVYAFIDLMERRAASQLVRVQLNQLDGARVRGSLVLRRGE
jgi:general secretion pathway protein M